MHEKQLERAMDGLTGFFETKNVFRFATEGAGNNPGNDYDDKTMLWI